MTEDEAKQRWCPFARKVITIDSHDNGCPQEVASANRDNNDKPISLCIGSSCMAWRFIDRLMGHDPSYNGEDAAKRFTTAHPLHGYCGLAGKP